MRTSLKGLTGTLLASANRAGREASEAGKPMQANPYKRTIQPASADAWAKGWMGLAYWDRV